MGMEFIYISNSVFNLLFNIYDCIRLFIIVVIGFNRVFMKKKENLK